MGKTDRDSLDVYYRDKLIGKLWLDESHRFNFQYDTEWVKIENAVPLSYSLPIREAPYKDDVAKPFFSNLLPEGGVRRMIARRLRISEQNDFAMLREIGGECAGAVSVLPLGFAPAGAPGYRRISIDELHKLMADLPKRPFLAGEKGIRLSLAGAQNKLPVYMEGLDIYIPTGNASTTHILKPAIPEFNGTVENEAFCMKLAELMDLSVPQTTIYGERDRLYLVKRYDRVQDQDGRVFRLHQEDFCQALGLLPVQKYESEGGPSLAQCFNLIKEVSIRPAADQKSLIRWIAYNILIGNADCHAKNLSILYTTSGPSLAPFYDLISTRVYPEISGRLAMKIGGENRLNWIQRRHWERLGAEINIKPRLITRLTEEMSTRITEHAGTLMKIFSDTYGPSSIIENIVKGITKIARHSGR
ncbi:putative kinase Y4mE [uncultured Desulfobacterium sp.]|uniref:Putative kinase Y4mE n=1 Tax=uncultured Desulfobacterium sp. TaxID=201089 RepID=A0A445MQR6_9BACT|nr:putative kinase Y4mE [uncultured Desulfobacterium sp.]